MKVPDKDGNNKCSTQIDIYEKRLLQLLQAAGPYWTYCDNFEWEYGFEPRFGLMRVNYDMINFQNQHNLQDDTSKILTKCGELYKNIIKVHTLSNM